jgi:hypothetical protein
MLNLQGLEARLEAALFKALLLLLLRLLWWLPRWNHGAGPAGRVKPRLSGLLLLHL